MEDQRRRDEQVMKEHQTEAARKGEMRLKSFYRDQKQLARERMAGGSAGGASGAQVKGDMSDFEAAYVQHRARARGA